MNGVKNDRGIINAREGMYAGKKYVFTHRDPDNGKVWSYDIPNGKYNEPGAWVPNDSVTWL